ncbi:MAG: hypothetical protein HFH87_14320, partial [Lachnospiraceae bacterium]|nr:hypothetical protein [Lachnospiraceae bacterium]
MKKSKTMKIVLPAAAALTVVLFIMAIVMLKAVKGDALFYMDSGKGYFYAVSYRWVCLAEGILLLFWIVLGVARRKAIMAMLPKVELKTKEAGKAPGEAQAAVETKAVVETRPEAEAQTVAEVKPEAGPQVAAETKPEARAQVAVEMKAVVETRPEAEA